MTSLRLHLKDVSVNQLRQNSTSIESTRTLRRVLGGFQSLYFRFSALKELISCVNINTNAVIIPGVTSLRI